MLWWAAFTGEECGVAEDVSLRQTGRRSIGGRVEGRTQLEEGRREIGSFVGVRGGIVAASSVEEALE